MSFAPEVSSIRPIIERRLIHVPEDLLRKFPDVLRNMPIQWMAFGDDRLMALVFLSSSGSKAAEDLRKEKLDPFPGLLTTKEEQPAAFQMNQSRFIVVADCTVVNSISFNVGRDSTFAAINHSVSIDTQQKGKIEYRLPLAYFVSFGEEITPESVYVHLDQLIAYTVGQWVGADV